MLVITGYPAGDFTWNLKYSLDTEIIQSSAGYEARYEKYSKPKRSLTFSIGAVDSLAFSQLSTLLEAGATFCVAPIWSLRENLTQGVSSGSNIVWVNNVNEFKVGDYAFLIRTTASVYDLSKISVVGTNFLQLENPVEHDYTPVIATSSWPYDVREGYAIPCIYGIVTQDSLDFEGGISGIQSKLTIDGGVWEGAEVDIPISSFLREPKESRYSQPKILRDVRGTENGRLQLRAYEQTSRMEFELTWDLIDNEWRELRDFFLAAKGSSRNFYMPTWMFELEILRGSDLGQTSIFLPSGYRYLCTRFPVLLVKPFRAPKVEPFLVTITGHVGNEEFSCEPLPHEVLLHDRVCFCPLVRFAADELQFDFKHPEGSICQVKASFIEVLGEED